MHYIQITDRSYTNMNMNMNMNDLRTASMSLTVEELRLIRGALADIIELDQNALECLEGDEWYEPTLQHIRDMDTLYIKVTRELEAIVGVMA